MGSPPGGHLRRDRRTMARKSKRCKNSNSHQQQPKPGYPILNHYFYSPSSCRLELQMRALGNNPESSVSSCNPRPMRTTFNLKKRLPAWQSKVCAYTTESQRSAPTSVRESHIKICAMMRKGREKEEEKEKAQSDVTVLVTVLRYSSSDHISCAPSGR